MNTSRMRFLALGLGLAWSLQALAWPPTFGDELNFTNSRIEEAWEKQRNRSWVNNPVNEAFRDAFAEAVRASCDGCVVRAAKDKYGVRFWKVRYADGWSFRIAVDPGVVEVQVGPTTLAQMQALRERIDRDIFANARAVGLRKDSTGDHMHIGLRSAFDGNLALFRDFYVNEVNHPELGGEFFGHDIYNAPVVGVLARSQQKALRKIVADVDAGKITTIAEFARRVRDKVYHRTTLPGWTPPEKFQAFNLSRVGNPDFPETEQTVEKRTLPSLESADDMILQAELDQAHLDRLRGRTERVPLNIRDPRAMSLREKFENFHTHVTQAHLDFARFRKYLHGPARLMRPQAPPPPPLCQSVYLFEPASP